MIQAQSFYEGIAASSGEEIFTTLFEKAGLKIERIASYGQASPPGFWYDQPQDEWVLLVRGQATLEIQGQPSLALQLGDHVSLPAHTRHRVTETSEDALWLAVHLRV